MKKLLKGRRKYGPGEVLWLLILVLLAFLILYPMFWILMSSVKDYQIKCVCLPLDLVFLVNLPMNSALGHRNLQLQS